MANYLITFDLGEAVSEDYNNFKENIYDFLNATPKYPDIVLPDTTIIIDTVENIQNIYNLTTNFIEKCHAKFFYRITQFIITEIFQEKILNFPKPIPKNYNVDSLLDYLEYMIKHYNLESNTFLVKDFFIEDEWLEYPENNRMLLGKKFYQLVIEEYSDSIQILNKTLEGQQKYKIII
jgi:hypothetical protein